MRTFTICHLLCFSLLCARGWGEESGNLKAEKFSGTIGVEISYLISFPSNYDKQEHWPLILFLHGAGERGDDVNRVKVHGPPKLVSQGKDLPFIVVSPQCPKDSWWDVKELSALLDDIVKKHHVDQDRIYLTGLSMGGFGTWSLARHTPQRFAAIAPICGGGDPQFVRDFKTMPIWVFHGAKDKAVPLQRSVEMVDAIKAQGGSPLFTIYPEAAHDSWTETYDNPELYTWFLKHRRVPKE